jgi:peptidase C39-like protein
MRSVPRSAVLLSAICLIAGCGSQPVVAPSPSVAPSAAATDSAVPSPSLAPTPTPIPQPPDKAPVSFARTDLARGMSAGVSGAGPLQLASTGLAGGTYDDPFGAKGIAYESGTWTSDWTAVSFPFDQLVASWSADTPANTWIRVDMQARGADRETKFYTMVTWASGDSDIHRTSTPEQKDADGDVNIDTFVRAKNAAPLDGYRLRVTLFRRAGMLATPTVRTLAAMTSAAFAFKAPSPFEGSAVDLSVPTFSQEIHAGEFPEYDGGGEAWCSPTSTSMVVAFHGAGPTPDDLAAFPGPGYDDPMVDYAARYAYDWNYKGAGNWPDNVAYASRFGLDGFVTRLRSLSEAERFIDASIPLVASINGALPGFLGGTTNGHLLVIRGFDNKGDVITNDPAVKSDEEARKVYARADFERVWLGGSAGIVYVIYPRGKALPPNEPGLPANW